LAYLTFFFKNRIHQLLLRSRHSKIVLLAIPIAIFGIFLSPSLNTNPLGIRVLNTPDNSHHSALLGVFYFGTLTSIAYIALFSFLIFYESRIRDILSLKCFHYLATLGYGIFLVHMPVALYLSNLTIPLHHRFPESYIAIWMLNVVATLASSIVVAYILHLTIEKPFLRLRDLYFAPRLKKAQTLPN
jgi:peptidoglycan/LPS O-acetylase OafA/YrhL